MIKKYSKKASSRVNKNSKTKKLRPSPSESATSLPLGTIKPGNDGQHWVIVQNKKGIPRWSPITQATMNGWKLLTTDYLAKNIGKKIVFYERMYENTWPTTTDKMQQGVFTPNGDLELDRKKQHLIGWLKTQKPLIKPGQLAMLLGTGGYVYENKNMNSVNDFSLQIDSKHTQLVSGNVMNMQAFIKA